MGFFDEMLVSARDVALNVSKQAEEVVDISKLKFEMRDLEKERKECYENIGMMYCQTVKDGVDYSEKCKSIMYRIDNINARINELSNGIADKISKPKSDNKDDFSNL